MELHLEKEIAILEAIFYLDSEPLSEDSLARIAGLGRDVIDATIEKLQEKYAAEDSGVELTRISGGWIITPKKDLWLFLKDHYGKKNESKLSKAAMETLSIIAYKQPITRSEIEAIRGVSADTMMRLLIEKELIKEVGKKDIPGKPIQYGTTRDFLKFFRLNSISDLPKLDEEENERFELAR
ncbi:MAG: SMC-Scp complex subunit ScpB [Treponemataceae bacterium]